MCWETNVRLQISIHASVGTLLNPNNIAEKVKLKFFLLNIKAIDSIRVVSKSDLINLKKAIPNYKGQIFVAPVPSDYNVNLQDVKYLIPYANKFNTFFFSEYNHYDEEFDFSKLHIYISRDMIFPTDSYRETFSLGYDDKEFEFYEADGTNADSCSLITSDGKEIGFNLLDEEDKYKEDD